MKKIYFIISMLILPYLLSTVTFAQQCAVSSISNVGYVVQTGRSCQARGRVHPNNQKILIYFVGRDGTSGNEIFIPGCDRAYDFNFRDGTLTIYRGIDNRWSSIEAWASNPFAMPYLRRDGDAFQRIINDRTGSTNVTMPPSEHWKIFQQGSLANPTTGRYITNLIEDGGDGWPNVPRCAPGGPLTFNFYDPEGCGWARSGLDGNVQFDLVVNCPCTAAPSVSLTNTQPSGNNVSINPNGSVNISFSDSSPFGSANCGPRTQIRFYRLDSVGLLAQSNWITSTTNNYTFPSGTLLPGKSYMVQLSKEFQTTTNVTRTANGSYIFSVRGSTHLIGLNAPVSLGNLINYSMLNHDVNLNIRTNPTTNPILSFVSRPFLSNTSLINQVNISTSNTSSRNVIMVNYNDNIRTFGLGNEQINYYNTLLNRVSNKRDTQGNDISSHISNILLENMRNTGNTYLNTRFTYRTFAQNTQNTDSKVHALFHFNPLIPSSMNTQNVTMTNVECRDNVMHFINGSLIINPNLISTFSNSEMYKCVYVVRDNLIIQGGNPANTSSASGYDILEGFFVVNGYTMISADASGDGLMINGGIVTKGFAQLNSQNLPLSGTTGLLRNNATKISTPPHIVKHDPAIPILFRDLLGARKYSLRSI